MPVPPIESASTAPVTSQLGKCAGRCVKASGRSARVAAASAPNELTSGGTPPNRRAAYSAATA